MSDLPAAPEERLPDLIRALKLRTAARVLVGRAGPAYRTATQLELREDHAAAADAVHAELDPARDFGTAFIEQWRLFTVQTQAKDKGQYLLRPDLGRKLAPADRERIGRECPSAADLQVVIGDGLSAAAVIAQVPGLLPLLAEQALSRGWTFGRPFVVRYCRVGVLNDIGDALHPRVVVLLIGERPGLATAESLSGYLAYCPRPGDTDAQRNLISNIHARGVPLTEAAVRTARLAEKMLRQEKSGVTVKEDAGAMDHLKLDAPAS